MTPADRPNAFCLVVTGFVAKTSIILLLACAGQDLANASAIGFFLTRDTNVVHTCGTVGGTYTAANVVKIFAALRVKKETLLFARGYAIIMSVIIALITACVASTATVGVRFVAVGSIITEI